MTAEFDLNEYRKELDDDYKKGLIDAEELAEALNFVSERPAHPGATPTTIEERPDTDPIVVKLENLYYRELFDRVRTTTDDKLFSTALVAFRDQKPMGALWSAPEPAPDYQHCMYLDMLFVREEFRGSGLSTRLLLELVNRTEERCIITYAWKPAIGLYSKHGFLTTEQETEKEEQEFFKMVLPLTKSSFDRYCRENDSDPLECYSEIIASSPLRSLPDFAEQLAKAIQSCTPEQEGEINQNPFTVFLLQKAKLEHRLLK